MVAHRSTGPPSRAEDRARIVRAREIRRLRLLHACGGDGGQAARVLALVETSEAIALNRRRPR